MFDHRLMNGFQTLFTIGARCRRSCGVPTAAGRQQQQQLLLLQRVWGQSGARDSSDNFRGVGINLWRLLRSVPRGAACWLRTGAVRTCVVLWIFCYARVILYMAVGCPVCGADITIVMRIFSAGDYQPNYLLLLCCFATLFYQKNIKHVDFIQ